MHWRLRGVGMAGSCSVTIPTWRQLLSTALQANQHLKHSRYFQLATVRSNGSPANRTVVFRDFVEGTDKLQFTTDSRSQKIHEIKFCPKGEICYYFTDTWEQFRIRGSLEVIGHSELDPTKKLIKEKAWFASSVKSRMQFAGPQPGLPVVAFEEDILSELNPKEGPLDSFCVVTLEPEEVDYLHLRENKRCLFTRLWEDEKEISYWTQSDLIP